MVKKKKSSGSVAAEVRGEKGSLINEAEDGFLEEEDREFKKLLGRKPADETTSLVAKLHHDEPPFRKKASAMAIPVAITAAALFSAMFYAAPAEPFAECVEYAVDGGDGFFSFLSNTLMLSAITGNALINYLLITMLVDVYFAGKFAQEKFLWASGLVFALFSLVPGFELNLTGFKFFGTDTGNETSQTLGLDISVTAVNWLPTLVGAVRLLRVSRAAYLGGDDKTRSVRAMLERTAESVNQRGLNLLKLGQGGSLRLGNSDELSDAVVELLQYYNDNKNEIKDIGASSALAYSVLTAASVSRIGLTLTAAFFWDTRVNPWMVPLSGFTLFCSMGLAKLGMDNLGTLLSRLNVLSALHPTLARAMMGVGATIGIFSGTGPGAAALKGWAWLLGILDLTDGSTPCHIARDANSSQVDFMVFIVLTSYAASAIISNFPLIILNLQKLALNFMKHRSPATKEAVDAVSGLMDFITKLSTMESAETLACLSSIQGESDLLQIVAEKTDMSRTDLLSLARQEQTVSGCKQVVDRVVDRVSFFVSMARERCGGRREPVASLLPTCSS